MLYVSSLSEFFSLVRKERKGQKEESIPLLNTFCRLAATSANTLPRQSRYSIATATGSKRSSADSDSLLCHVRLWRTSRLKFGCASGCEHSEIRFILIVPSAHILDSRPPTLLCGRADNACTNLLGFFVCYVRTRGSMRLRGAVKPPTFALPFVALTRHAWLARLTRARGGVLKESGKLSLMTFGILRLGDAVQRWLRHPEPSSWSYKSRQKSIVSFTFLQIREKCINLSIAIIC